MERTTTPFCAARSWPTDRCDAPRGEIGRALGRVSRPVRIAFAVSRSAARLLWRLAKGYGGNGRADGFVEGELAPKKSR